MESFIIFVYLVSAVVSLIMIVKFFGIASDIRRIRKILESDNRENAITPKIIYKGFEVGDIVIIDGSDEKMRIKSIENGLFKCYDEKADHFVGSFKAEQLQKLEDNTTYNFKIGELVINRENGKVVEIKEIKGNKYTCYSNNGKQFEGSYSGSKLRRM